MGLLQLIGWLLLISAVTGFLLACFWGPARKEREELRANWGEFKREVFAAAEPAVRWLNRRLGGRVMGEPIPPALSPEEWAKRQIAAKGWLAYIVSEEDAPDEVGQLGITSSGHDGESFEGRARHAIAALALHGQPFGFKPQDKIFLREMADIVEDSSSRSDVAATLRDLAARIEALLPPSDEKPPA